MLGQPVEICRRDGTRRFRDRPQCDNGLTVTSNDDLLSVEGAVDQVRQPVLGFGYAVGAHATNMVIGWQNCPVRHDHRRVLIFIGDTNTRSTRRPSILTTSNRQSPEVMRSASIGTRL